MHSDLRDGYHFPQMTGPQARLWQTLQSTPLGPAGAVITFEDKLITHTGWPRNLAQRAIMEYRRYLLLAATAGHGVSPSPTVDEVWHLHLLYTRHYWKTLCPDILGTEIHHEPATGVPTNRAALDDDYAKTLASYAGVFGEPPPADIWPKTPRSGKFVRVDADRFFVLPKHAAMAAAIFCIAIIVFLIILVLMAFAR